MVKFQKHLVGAMGDLRDAHNAMDLHRLKKTAHSLKSAAGMASALQIESLVARLHDVYDAALKGLTSQLSEDINRMFALMETAVKIFCEFKL